MGAEAATTFRKHHRFWRPGVGSGRTVAVLLLLLLLAFPAGCRRLPPEIEPLTLRIEGLRLVEATLFEQAYRIALRITNPNRFAVPVEGIRYEIDLNGELFASGISAQEVSVPPLGQAVIEVATVSTLPALLRQLLALARGEGAVRYRLTGSLYLPDERKQAIDCQGEIAPGDLGIAFEEETPTPIGW